MIRKLTKLTSYTLTIIMLLLVTLIGAAYFYINTNDFKQRICQVVLDQTGYPLRINRPIAWSFFPWFGLKLEGVQLDNPRQHASSPVLRIKEVDFKIALLPLIKHHILVHNLQLRQITLNLQKNKNGETNWSPLAQRLHSSHALTNKTTSLKEEPTSSFQFDAIDRISVIDATIHFTDLSSQQRFSLNHISLESHTLRRDQAFPLQLSFDVTQPQKNYTLTFSLNTQLHYKRKQQILTLSKLSSHNQLIFTQPKKTFPFSLTGAIRYLLKQNLLTTERLQIDALSTKSFINLTMKLPDTFSARGKLIITQCDLNKVLQILHQKLPDYLQKTAFEHSSAEINYTANQQSIRLAPIKFRIGSTTGNAIVDIKQNNTRYIKTQGTLENIHAEDLFQFEKPWLGFTGLNGIGTLKWDVSLNPKSKQSLLRSLSGKVQGLFENGYLKGRDLGYEIAQILSLAGRPISAHKQNTRQTKFLDLQANFIFKHGISQTDTLLKTPIFTAQAKGQFDLNKDTLNLQIIAHIIASSPNNPIAKLVNTIKIPILVKGTSDDYHVDVQMAKLARSFLLPHEKHIKKTVQKEVNKNLKKLLKKNKSLLKILHLPKL